MARPLSLAQRLRQAGVTDVDRTARWIEQGPLGELGTDASLADLAAAGSADDVVLALMRLLDADALRDALTEPAQRRVLYALAGASHAASDYLATHPGALERISSHVRPLHAAPLASVLDDADAYAASMRRGWLELVQAREVRPDVWVAAAPDSDALRRAYREALLGLAASDLTSENPTAVFAEVAARVSALADAVISAALACARALVDPHGELGFGVIALGKCGARELNYISDVDLMYVVDSDDADALRRSGRLAVALAQVISGPGAEAPLWELDLGLRPEGKDGAIVRTRASYADYYRSWAHNWEFQALMKARACAGNLDLARGVIDDVSPLVWQAAHREGFIEEARAMRARVEQHIPTRERDHQIKLGPGGLRDVEFSVQLLQLVHGGADPALRKASTLEGIEALVDGGYIGRDAGETLRECYEFLRVLEHRTQLLRMRRTHVIPTRDTDVRRIGRAIDAAAFPHARDLRDHWEHVRTQVRGLHRDLFYRPLLSVVAAWSPQAATLSTEAGRERLRFLGYRDPDGALRHLKALGEGVSRRAAIQRQLMPGIIEWLRAGPDPDGGLLAFRQLSEAIGSSHWYLGMLRDSRVAADRLCRVLATSPYVAARLADLPEAVRWLDAETIESRPAGLAAELDALQARHDDPSQAYARIRAVRAREFLRSALTDVLDGVTSPGTDLAEINDETLAAGLSVATRESDVPVILIAMGSQGACEASYASDADVVLVYDGADANEGRRIIQSLRGGLGDVGSTVGLLLDVDLRPEGTKGPLASSFAAYASHYRGRCETWERQALLRARVIAGDRALARRWQDLVDEIRYAHPLDEAGRRQVRLLKARMENERLPRGVEPSRHVKLGPGGLSDVEWVAQLLQLDHAKNHESLRSVHTLEVLQAAREAGLIAPEDVSILTDSWLLAGRIRRGNALMSASPRPRVCDQLPATAHDLSILATVLGHGEGKGGQLADDYRKVARRARSVAERLIYGRV